MKSKLLICLTLASIIITGCKSTEEKAADAALISNCGLHTYKNYQEIIDNNPNQIASLTPQYTYYKGSSLLPFGSRDNAVNEAKLSVCKKNLSNALAIADKEKTYYEGGGSSTHHIYYLMPFTLTDITEQELASQLELWVPSNDAKFSKAHRKYLLQLAKNKKFSNLLPTLEKLIKSAEAYTESSYSTPLGNSLKWKELLELHKELVDLYVFYKGDQAENKLIAWVKYHKQKSVKLASYQGLITLGKLSVVEDLLANEDNSSLKKHVGMMLL